MNTVWKLKKTWQALTAASVLAISVLSGGYSVASARSPAHAADASVPTLDPSYGLAAQAAHGLFHEKAI